MGKREARRREMVKVVFRRRAGREVVLMNDRVRSDPRTRIGERTRSVGPRVFVMLLGLLLCAPLSGEEMLIPSIAGRVVGAFGSDWASEIRITNLSSAPKYFSTTDWIGTPGWSPKTWTIPAGQILAIGGTELFGDPEVLADRTSYFGAVVASVDEGLLVQAAILAGFHRTGGDAMAICPSWAGGYAGPEYSCNTGAGPVIDATRFFPPGSEISLPWLNTDPGRRTNVCFVNPDPTDATVSVEVRSADGALVQADVVVVGAHSLLQLDDVFASRWWSVRDHNGYPLSAARLSARGSTRLYALAWVISKDNNTVSASTPFPGP